MENHVHDFGLKEVEHFSTGSVHTKACSCGDTQTEHRDLNNLLISMFMRSKMKISDAYTYFANNPAALEKLKKITGV